MEALKEFEFYHKQNDPHGDFDMLGMRCVKWKEQPTKRFLYRMVVMEACIPMIGMCLYNFINKGWLTTWSVFMPQFNEVYEEEWEIVQHEEIKDKSRRADFVHNIDFVQLLINVHKLPVSKSFLEKYEELWKKCQSNEGFHKDHMF